MDSRIMPGVGVGFLHPPDDLAKQAAWLQYAPTRTPLVVGAGLTDTLGSFLPNLQDCAWVGLYPLAFLLLEKRAGREHPVTPEPIRHIHHTIMDEVEFAREDALHDFWLFLDKWGLAKPLGVHPPPRSSNRKGRLAPPRTRYHESDEHLFGAKFFRERKDVDLALLRWNSASFIVQRDDSVPLSRLVASRTVDLILSELLNNAFSHGIATSGSKDGEAFLLAKVVGRKSCLAALASDRRNNYLTPEERSLYRKASDNNTLLLELVIADNGRGFSGKKSFSDAFKRVQERDPNNGAELILFALDGRYTSKSHAEIIKEFRSYEFLREEVLPEIHGLGELKRVIREHSGHWRIHSRSGIVELNFHRPYLVGPETMPALRHLIADPAALAELAALPRASCADLLELHSFLKPRLSPNVLLTYLHVIADACVTNVNVECREAQGTIHQIILPFDDFVQLEDKSFSRRWVSLEGFRKEPTEVLVADTRPELVDVAQSLRNPSRLEELYRRLEELVESKSAPSTGSTPLMLNLSVLDQLPDFALVDTVALVANAINRLARRRAVYLSGLSEQAGSHLRRMRCLSGFFTERRVVPFVTMAYERNRFDVDVLLSPELELVRPQLRKALSLLHDNFASFRGLSDELVTLLHDVQVQNSRYLVKALDSSEPGLRGTVQMFEDGSGTLSHLLGAESPSEFAKRLVQLGGIQSGAGRFKFKRYERESDYYIHLAALSGNDNFIDRIHNWMLGALLHTEGIGPFLRQSGQEFALIPVLQPAIKLTRGFVFKAPHFSNAEIVPVRRISDIAWDYPEFLDLRAKSCVIVIDVCSSYETVRALIAALRVLGCSVIATLAIIAPFPVPDDVKPVMAFADENKLLEALTAK